MQFSNIFCAAIMAVSVSAERVTWDAVYDDPDKSLANVACSNLEPEYHILGNLPNFPHVGGKLGVEWGSKKCGSCWNLQYKGKSVKILAIDHAGEGFNIGKDAMIALAGNEGIQSGHLDVKVSPLTRGDCGM